MSLQDLAQERTVPAQAIGNWAARLAVGLMSVFGRAIETIKFAPSRPLLGVIAGDGTWRPAGGDPLDGIVKLGRAAKGVRGTVVRLATETDIVSDGIAASELERRLLEIGFVEGAAVEILHEGFIRRDPIAVRLDDMRVALRRRDAEAILVRISGAGG